MLDHAIRTGSDARRTGVDPEIDVGLSRRDDDWVIRVRNSGPGLDEAEAARLFASFGPDPEDADGDGAPGLAVCRRIVERHGGTIWAESVPGRGPDICFTLPATPDDAASPG